MNANTKGFDRLVQEAWEHGIHGWDWQFVEGRVVETLPSWDYPNLAKERMAQARSMLEIGTGGGELFSTLGPFPPCTIALEAYPPSVRIAWRRLHPLGIEVVCSEDNIAVPLPFASAAFDLAINRHADYSPEELVRVLRPGGFFLTQQVGGRNNFRLNELLQEQPHFINSYWTLEFAVEQLISAGFDILMQQEQLNPVRFLDIGAVVYYLSIISWQVEGFEPGRYLEKLWKIHQIIQSEGALVTHFHRFIIQAVKKDGI